MVAKRTEKTYHGSQEVALWSRLGDARPLVDIVGLAIALAGNLIYAVC